MERFLLVFLGGGLGSVVRYFVNDVCYRYTKYSFFCLTILVNILGCFFMGALLYTFLGKTNMPEYNRLFLTVGFCGGLTTFSGFTAEIFKLMQTGEIAKGLTYAFISIFFALIAFVAGILFVQKISA
ncbi:MAG: fluoride efflux transporter CrcB [Clostridiaceae bacterium]|jgi:fluoride exporter|nr:fluoride efflux transporter CrcB [Clostridiaceae bacterium]